MIYLDHAATSWPKPPGVVDAMIEAVTVYGANPGRGSHSMSLDASRSIYQARSSIARLFSIKDPNRLVFTKNTTEALNLALFGFLKNDDHVICTSIEHNSVRRPLEYLKKTKRISITYLEHSADGELNADQIADKIQPNTRLIVVTHGSNLLGTIIDLAKIKEIAESNSIPILVDCAQTAGVFPISIRDLDIDFLAMPGHKGLLGPQGTGVLYVSPKYEIEPFIYGGTGSRSEDIEQPKIWPEGYEAGTINTPGIAGLSKGVNYVLEQLKNKPHIKEWELTQYIIEKLLSINTIKILGPTLGKPRCGLISFTHSKLDAAEFSNILDKHYSICVRSGFHCAPMAHQLAGTIETGAIRASVGWNTKLEDVEQFINAIKEIEKSL